MPTTRRKCSVCGDIKTLTEFARSYRKDKTPDMATYYLYRCKECERERNRERDRNRDRTEYWRNRDQSPTRKQWVREREEKKIAEGFYKHQWRTFSAEKQQKIIEQRKLRKYRLTKKDYDELLKSQNGACAICGYVPKAGQRKLAIDHDHDTGNVRGLLCVKCNPGLGYFQDDISLLKKAQAYLKKFK